MGLLIRLVLLLGTLAVAGGFCAWAFTEMFATAQEILLPFLLICAAILVTAIGYLVSSFRRR